MNESKHTPGPWKIDADYFAIRHTTTGPNDCDLIASYHRKQDDSHAANARLIAAAPELLRGCQAALAYLTDPVDEFASNRKAAEEIITAAVRKALHG